MAAPLMPIALMMLAQAAVPAAPDAQARPAASVQARCGVPTGDTIVVCAEKPDGYRIDPDIMAARRGMKPGSGAPRANNPAVRPDCATVGPAPCMTAGVNLLGVALTAAEMASRLAKGEEIGSMFKTDPSPSEYQLYRMAKAEREAKQAAQAAARIKAKAAPAAPAAPSAK